MKAGSLVFALCACFVVLQAEKDLPPEAPRCKRTDPELNKCLLDATDKMRPLLKAGIPTLGVPSVDPLTLPEIILEQGTQALNFKAVAKDVKISGLTKYVFKSMEYDVDKMIFKGVGTIDDLDIDGDVTINGKILVAPITGQGKFDAKVETVNVDVYQTLERIQKKGKDYLRTKSGEVKIKLSKPSIHFNGLFGNDPQLGEATNRLINENADILFEDLTPTLEKVINQLVDKLLFKTIVESVPYDKLLPAE